MYDTMNLIKTARNVINIHLTSTINKDFLKYWNKKNAGKRKQESTSKMLEKSIFEKLNF